MHVFVHGGAGSAPAEPESRQATLDGAVAAGAKCEQPQAAVIEAVRRLESDPRFNAGTGSAVQSDGRIRTEAGLMTGDGESGGVCSMVAVEHAIDVARIVKEETPHVLIAGDRAVALADAYGVDTEGDLWTDDARETWTDATGATGDGDSLPQGDVGEQIDWLRDHFGTDSPREDHDTVGAVATDGDRLAAGTSTGGRWFSLAGRVGDVPQIGAGFYATDGAAASATGEGEAIARFGLARQAVAAVEEGDDPQTAADRVIRGFEAETGGKAGVIVVDSDGATGKGANTEAMQTARSDSAKQ